ncbi:MAG: YecA family protein [Thermodesulfobacteriota bacterium]
MPKPGRNDLCPCGSGQKYKKCCLGKRAAVPARPAIPSVTAAVVRLQETAAAKKAVLRAMGVFILFATPAGDAWLLEVTDMDAIQVARAGDKLEVEIEESPETIEINWTHRFAIRDRRFVLTAYADNSEEVRTDYPAHAIKSTLQKIRKRIPAELLGSIHLDDQPAQAAG